MKPFYPFLMITIIFCMLCHSIFTVHTAAQRSPSFASAQSLSMNHSVSAAVPAYDSVCYYFYPAMRQASSVVNYRLTYTASDSVTVSLYDDQGTSRSLSSGLSDSKQTTVSFQITSDSHRYFLVLRNQTKHTANVKLTLSPAKASAHAADSKTASPKPKRTSAPGKSKTRTKATAKPKASKKHTQNSTKPKADKKHAQNSTKPKAGRKHAQSSAKPKAGRKHAQSSTKPKADKKRTPDSTNSQTDEKRTPDSINSQTDTSRVRTSGTPACTRRPASTPFSSHTLNQATANPATHPYSSSYQNLSAHFCRMTAGYSTALEELLPSGTLPGQNVTYENLTPDRILLQSDIVYAKSSGPAVIKIISSTHVSSCTIYIQEPS